MARRYPIEERFWSKVDIRGPIPEHVPHLGRCWIWTAGRYSKGYGMFWVDTTMRAAHRVAWVLTRGQIPADKPHVLHHCDNPPCVRPEHLWVGTNDDNVQDKISKGRSNPVTGERHGSHTRPDRVARGERHGSRTKPWRVPRGNRTGSHLHPESRPRGEGNKAAKLTEGQVREIRNRKASGEKMKTICRDFGIHRTTVTRIWRNLTWTHVD